MTTPKKRSSNDRPLTPIMEDYMEAIFDLNREKAAIRVRDIAKKLRVKMPTVSSMLKILNDRGLVQYRKYEYVILTRSGIVMGREIRRRHDILLKFLTEVLGIDYPVADREACRLEHAIGPVTISRLKDLTAFVRACANTSVPGDLERKLKGRASCSYSTMRRLPFPPARHVQPDP